MTLEIPSTLFMQSSLSIDSLASNPRSANFDTIHRQDQILHLQRALSKTLPPPPEESNHLSDYVPTSIAIAGPGNYGRKEVDDANEVVLLNDDVLTSVANATVVIIDGNDLERISVLYQFPQFLEHCPQESINVMVPRICLECISWSPEAQMAAVEALYFVANVKVPYRVANQMACAALQMTSDSYHTQVFDACGEIVSMILPQVHRYDVLQNIVSEAIDRAVSSNPHQRRLAARIIGSLNDTLDANELEGIFIKSSLNLSVDEDESVRALISRSMAALGAKLPLRVSETLLWPRLRDLTFDDSSSVKAAAMRAIARSAEAHRFNSISSPSFETLIMPIFMIACKRAAGVAASDLRSVSDDTYLLLEIFSEVYGYFVCALSNLIDKDRHWETVLGTLRLMVTCNGPTVRHWCAFNIPAIATFCSDEKSVHMKGILQALAGDSDLETRATLASGIHEVAKSLRHSMLRNDLIAAIGMLFMDESAQVRMNALGHFSELLSLLSPIGAWCGSDARPAEKKGGAQDGEIGVKSATGSAKGVEDVEEIQRLAPMFSSLDLMACDSWRTQRLLAEEVQRAAHLIPQEMLCEHVAPLLFQMARESTFLVRKASMRALVHVIRYVSDVRRRNHILKHFKAEWAHGKVYWTRLAFVEASECAFSVFSLKLFTSLFMNEVLGLKDDSVVNVRLRLVRFLKDMAKVWKNLVNYREALIQLADDKDFQVSSEALELWEGLENVGEWGAEEREKDGQKEDAENCFFIHTKHRKRKSKSKRSETGGTLLHADELGDMESLVSNDIGLLAANGVDVSRTPGMRKGSSRGKLSVVGVESLTDPMGEGHGVKKRKGEKSAQTEAVSFGRVESNNSALADQSPTKHGTSAGLRAKSHEDAVNSSQNGPIPGVTRRTASAQRSQLAGTDNDKREPIVRKRGLLGWFCGCFSGR